MPITSPKVKKKGKFRMKSRPTLGETTLLTVIKARTIQTTAARNKKIQVTQTMKAKRKNPNQIITQVSKTKMTN